MKTTQILKEKTSLWTPCPSLDSQFQCASVSVPVDYKQPGGPSLILKVIKRLADSKNKKGTLVVNFGGPWGEDTVQLPAFAKDLYPEVRYHFDLVSFNPRGTGHNAVACDSPFDPDIIKLNLDTDFSVKKLIDLTHKQASYCSSEYKRITAQNIATTVTTTDLETIRKKLQLGKLSFLGYSYGTLLGALYYQNYPENMRALVLDGNMSPYSDFQHLLATFANGVEKVAKHFFEECTEHNTQKNAHCRSFTSYEEYFGGMLKRAATYPIPNSANPALPLTAGMIRNILLTELQITRQGKVGAPFWFARNKWPDIARGIEQVYLYNDSAILYNTLQNPVVPQLTMNDTGALGNAVRCADYQNHYNNLEIINLAKVMREKYPVLGSWFFASSAVQCIGWPDASATHFPDIHTKNTTMPALVIGAENDPGTVYMCSKEMHKAISGSILQSWTGSGHTTYMSNEYPGHCVADSVNNYLVNSTLPQNRTNVCSELSHPFNTEVVSAPIHKSAVQRWFAVSKNNGRRLLSLPPKSSISQPKPNYMRQAGLRAAEGMFGGVVYGATSTFAHELVRSSGCSEKSANIFSSLFNIAFSLLGTQLNSYHWLSVCLPLAISQAVAYGMQRTGYSKSAVQYTRLGVSFMLSLLQSNLTLPFVLISWCSSLAGSYVGQCAVKNLVNYASGNNAIFFPDKQTHKLVMSKLATLDNYFHNETFYLNS